MMEQHIMCVCVCVCVRTYKASYCMTRCMTHIVCVCEGVQCEGVCVRVCADEISAGAWFGWVREERGRGR